MKQLKTYEQVDAILNRLNELKEPEQGVFFKSFYGVQKDVEISIKEQAYFDLGKYYADNLCFTGAIQ